MGAMGDRLRLVATTYMDDFLPLTPCWWLPALPVTPQGHEHIEEVLALFGEAVFAPGWSSLIEPCLQHPVGDEALESVGENVAGDAEIVDELVEPAHPEERVHEG